MTYDEISLWNDLGDMKREMLGQASSQYLAAGSVVGGGSFLSLGYVFWTIRSGWLVTTLLAQMPAWRFIDPLVVFDCLDEETDGSRKRAKRGDDDDSLQSLLKGQPTGSNAPTRKE